MTPERLAHQETPPAFHTKRLRVWELVIRPSPEHHPRHVYLACRQDIDRPAVIATMTVWAHSPLAGAYIEWAEVPEPDRRRGFATELCRAVEKRLGVPLIWDGATDEGRAFEKKWDRRKKAVTA